MAAKTLKMAIALGLCNTPLCDVEQNLCNELRDYLAHAHMRHINKLRKDGKPFETADYQIKEFLDEILSEIPATKGES